VLFLFFHEPPSEIFEFFPYFFDCTRVSSPGSFCGTRASRGVFFGGFFGGTRACTGVFFPYFFGGTRAWLEGVCPDFFGNTRAGTVFFWCDFRQLLFWGLGDGSRDEGGRRDGREAQEEEDTRVTEGEESGVEEGKACRRIEMKGEREKEGERESRKSEKGRREGRTKEGRRGGGRTKGGTKRQPSLCVVHPLVSHNVRQGLVFTRCVPLFRKRGQVRKVNIHTNVV